MRRVNVEVARVLCDWSSHWVDRDEGGSHFAVVAG